MNDNTALQRIEPEQNDLIVHQPLPPPSLFGTADPVEVVARASRVAASLKEVIKAQGLISKISGKEYPRCEAWTLLGTMLGVFPVLVWTRAMEGGWEARVEARTRDGSIVGAAEAQCLKSERNWGNRDDFALRSMAQTRATAKALRMPLGFVMTLGGFQATPAEEMDFEQGKTVNVNPKPKPEVPHGTKPSAPSAQPKAATAKTRDWFLSEMRKRFDEMVILQYGMDKGPPYMLVPGEHLEDWRLEYVPTTKPELEAKIAECAEFMGVEPRKTPQDAPESSPASQKSFEDEMDAIEPPGGWQGASGADSDAESEGVETVTGKLEAVSVKEGKSTKGKWVRYGLKIDELWISTFSETLGKCAQQDKGHIVKIQFRRGEKGADLISIDRARNA